MPINTPIFQPQVNGGQVVDIGNYDFAPSFVKGYEAGRILAGIPQKLDQLKIAQQQQQIDQSGQEFPEQLALLKNQNMDAPINRSRLVSDILGESGVTSEPVVGPNGPNDIRSDAVSLALPGLPDVRRSPSLAQEDKVALRSARGGVGKSGERAIGFPFVGKDGMNYQEWLYPDGRLEARPLENDPGRMPQSSILFDSKGNAQRVSKIPGSPSEPVLTADGEQLKKEKTIPAEKVLELSGISELKTLATQVKESYKPEYVGAVDYPVGFLEQKFGLGASEQQAEFRSRTEKLANRLLYLYSGKQINENEFKRLMNTLPNPRMSEVDFNSRLADFITELDYLEFQRNKSLGDAGYYTGDKSQAAPPASTPSKPTSYDDFRNYMKSKGK